MDDLVQWLHAQLDEDERIALPYADRPGYREEWRP